MTKALSFCVVRVGIRGEVVYPVAFTPCAIGVVWFTPLMESAVECPRDTWSLVSSGYVKEPEYFIDRVSVELGYGGLESKINPKTGKSVEEYMIIVHEDLTKHHPVGKSKFFEDPVRRNEQLLLEHLGSRVKMAMNIRPGG